MIKIKALFLMCFVFGFFCLQNVWASDNVWKDFTNKPDRANYEKCKKFISSALSDKKIGEERIEKQLISDYLNFDQFILLARKGNDYAMDLAIKIWPFTDGGAREDLCQFLGMTVTKKTEELLILCKENNISDEQLEEIVTGMPVDEFTDRPKNREEEINKRILSLKKVKRIDLIGLRDKSIGFLANYLKEIGKIEK
jgi:hypothetical protein